MATDESSRTIDLQWDPAAGAERYVVEHWKLFEPGGPITMLPTGGPETAMTLRDVPGDVLSIGVRAENVHGRSDLGRPALVQVPDQRALVEALFFGTGPYGTGFFLSAPVSSSLQGELRNHSHPGHMLGWSGLVLVRVETSLNAAQLLALEAVLDDIRDLTGGEIQPDIVEHTDSLSRGFVPGELHVMARDSVATACGTGLADGCAAQDVLDARIVSAQVFLRRAIVPEGVIHEVGHALLGLHHIQHVQFQPRPVMSIGGAPSNGTFSDRELEAVRAVYRAGLRFGASRDDFRARQLVP